MARIRNIKPDFWTDEKLVELEPVDRLLFIGLWNFADDEGYLPYSPKRIKMQVFPGDSLEISRSLQNLISARVLTLYSSEAGEVLHVTNWAKHQKVSNPTRSKYSGMTLTPVTQKPRKQAEVTEETPAHSPSGTESSRELRTEREREREREREQGIPLTSRTQVTSEIAKRDLPRNRASRIVNSWLDEQATRPPGKVISDAAAQIQALTAEGIADEHIAAGVREWWQGQYPASMIPNYVANAQNGRGQPKATGTKRAADILAIDTSSIQ
jgi:hypothetical protein